MMRSNFCMLVNQEILRHYFLMSELTENVLVLLLQYLSLGDKVFLLISSLLLQSAQQNRISFGFVSF